MLARQQRRVQLAPPLKRGSPPLAVDAASSGEGCVVERAENDEENFVWERQRIGGAVVCARDWAILRNTDVCLQGKV